MSCWIRDSMRLNVSSEQKKEGKRYSFGIFLQDTDELVGEISLFRIELKGSEKWVLGYATDRLHLPFVFF